jgi:hypothetical protein
MTRGNPFSYKGHLFFIDKEVTGYAAQYFLYKDEKKEQEICRLEKTAYYDAIEQCAIDFEEVMRNIIKKEIQKL